MRGPLQQFSALGPLPRRSPTPPALATGVATAAGNGGAVSAGDINSGGNVGSAIAIGDTVGPDPDVYGGDILNETGMAVAVDGGTAIADATGGNNNLAFVS